MSHTAEFKVDVDRLDSVDDWANWKWKMKLLLSAHGLQNIVEGSRTCPVLTEASTAKDKLEVENWNRDSAKAASLIANALSKPIADLVLTSTNPLEIWLKLCARFERSSKQRLSMLLDKFFQATRNESEDICAHVAKLQKLFVDLNDELQRHELTTLNDQILNGRILSTLGKEYDNFKDLWDTIKLKDQTLNLLVEKLCVIESRDSRAGRNVSSAVAFVAQKTVKTSATCDKRNRDSSKSKRAKQKFPCRLCKKLGHWAAECPEKLKAAASSKTSGTLLMTHVLGTSGGEFMDANRWYCDSGASRHVTPSRHYFSTFTEFAEPKSISLGKRNVNMLALGQGDIQVQMSHSGSLHRATLTGVLYVPDASVHLISVQAASRNGLSVLMDDERVVFRRKSSEEIVAIGRLIGELYTVDMTVVPPAKCLQVNVAKSETTLQLYHERFAHQNKKHVRQLLNRLDIEVTADGADFCDGCALGKMHRLPFPSRTERAEKIGELIHTDVCGPMQTESFGGAKYYVCFKDAFSKFRRLFFLKQKSEVHIALQQFLMEAKTNGHVIKRLRSDGGTEYDNQHVAKLIQSHGIEHWISPPYTPEQNGVAERENRTIVEAARSMLQSSKLTKALWAEACNTAVYVLNRTAKSSVDGKSPYEVWYSKPVGSLDHLRIFGTGCYVHVQKQFRAKFDPKAVFGHMVGYVNERDGYRVYIPSLRKLVCTHDVRFKPEVVCNFKSSIATVEVKCVSEEAESADKETDLECKEPGSEEQEATSEVDASGSGGSDCDSSNEEAKDNGATTSRLRKKPKWMASGEFVCLASSRTIETPSTFSAAIKSDEKKEWLAAMQSELDSLEENETWELVTRPTHIRVLKNRWVFRVKTLPEDNLRFKARLVAKGYIQKKGVDYDETFSPVARYDTVRTLLAVSASRGLKLAQFDVKTAFLYGYLEEEVYLEQPEGFEDGTDRVCRLKRSLYGLKQAPRCWNKRFLKFMTKEGLENSKADPCMFHRNRNGKFLYVVIYVDDGLVAASSEDELHAFLRQLESEFKITVGSLKNFLGLQIGCAKDGSVTISQTAYTKKILEQFRMSEANSVATPASVEEAGGDEDVSEKVPYREAIGSLMYLMTATRPDIAFAVSKVSRSLELPTRANWNEVKRIFKYLVGTCDYRIVYKRSGGGLTVYSDADFAGCKKTRRSTSGVLAMFAGGAVSWSSQLQRTTAISTTESEIMAASEGAKELIWLRRLLGELSEEMNQPPTLYVDSASAVKLAKNPEYHKRSKHIEIRHFFVREKFLDGDLKIEHIEGANQLADILTKPLERVRFEKLRSEIGVIL